ncbi:MAG TPA: MerR family transcriptional regulator [Acidimicrobiales bacterium]|nr:MerR family transcriptional regulator [Acidimicrobiales bacterium]
MTLDEATPEETPAHGAAEYSIDELARLAGSNVRNVRLYQERGLLPRPRRVGRANRYGEGHLARLRLILDLLGKGYPLSAIRELVEAWEGQRSLADVLGFEQAVSAPFVTEAPRRYTAAELQAMFPDEEEPERSWRRAIHLELLVPDAGEFIAPSPALLEAGAELVADGVPVAAVLDVAATVRKSTDKLADAFVSMFAHHIWEPFAAAGMPADRLPDITEALERQRPLAEQAVSAAMAHAMQRRVDAVAKEHAPVLAKSSRGRRRRRRAS